MGGSNRTEIAAGIDISANVKDAITQIDKVNKSLGETNKQLVDVLKHFDDLNKKTLGNINKQINKNIQNRNISQQNIAENYDFGTNRKVAKNSLGSVIASDTGREKIFQEYEQAIIAETKAIEADIKERTKLRKQRADAENVRNQNTKDAISKREDKSSDAYRTRQDKLADAALLRAKAQQAGALLNNPGYQFGRAFQNIGNKIGTIGVGSDKIEGKMLGGVISAFGALLKSPIAGGAAALTSFANGITEVGQAAVKAYAEIESIKTQLGVVFSNQTQADSMFGEISQYAVKSPFGVQQTSELAVLLKQSGVYASDLMDTLKMIGDTAGGNMEKMKRIANNYAQIVSIGKASMLDMRQFAYAGIPIFEAVSKELGVSQQELRKLISDGKVTSDIIEKVFKDLTGINGIFENATEKGAKTLKARLQNLEDAKQLAMAGVGDYIVNFGSKTGNDSYINKLVTKVEDIYNVINERMEDKNSSKEKDVIAANEERIDLLKELIKNADQSSNGEHADLLKTIYQRELDKEIAKQDEDKKRALYVESYNAKVNGAEEILKGEGLEYSINNLNDLIERYEREYSELKESYEPYLKATAGATGFDRAMHGADIVENRKIVDRLNPYADETTKEEYLRSLQEAEDFYRQSIETLRAAMTVTPEERFYKMQSNVQNAQTSAATALDKYFSSSSSMSKTFEDIRNLQKNTEAWQQKEQEKEEKRISEALEVLKDLRTIFKDQTDVDITKLSPEKLLDYMEKGVFSKEGELGVLNEKSNYEKYQLRDNYQYAIDYIKKELGNREYDSDAEKLLDYLKYDSDQVFWKENFKNTEYFYNDFNEAFDGLNDRLSRIIEKSDSEEGKAFYTRLLNMLGISTLKLGVQTEGYDYVPDDEKKKGKELPDYIPLWKRVIANNTGWSAERITTSKDFMDEYKKYSAMQISRGGIQGLVQAGASAGEVGTLLSYAANKNKQGVHQVDWEKTEQNLYKYAINLETPLKRASATMKGLADAMQNQVDTYKKLTVDLYAAGEDWTTINNDIKGQYKTAQGLGNADVLDNAFEAFTKESDKFKVTFDDEKGLVVFDKLSNTIVGSVAELKEDSEIKDENLKKYLEGIKVDNLVNALDKASAEILRNSNITQVQSTMLEEANRLEQKRIDDIINTYGQSGYVLSEIYKARDKKTFSDKYVGSGITSRNDGTTEYETGLLVNEVFTNILKKISEMDLRTQSEVEKAGEIWEDKNGEGVKKNQATALKDAGFIGDELTKTKALQNVQEALNDPTQFSNAIAMFIEQFPEACERIIKEAKSTADALDSDKYVSLADKYLRNSPEGIYGALLTNRDKTGNTFEGQSYMDFLGASNMKWDTFSKELTTQVRANRQDNDYMLGMYDKQALKNLSGMDIAKEDIEQLKQDLEGLSNSEAFDKLEAFYSKRGLASAFEEATDSGNKLAVSLGKIGKSIDDIADNTKNMVDSFAADALTSSMQTWGEALAKGGDASEEMTKNMQQLTAGLLQNMGSMLTQAGLSLAISSTGDKAGVLAGLAIAAAGGGLSFLGGYLGGLGEEDKNKEDSELQKLLKLKQDLSDLLKQAREDAIYYENTVRHKSAISANSEFTTKSVHDAIITPRGDVVTTDPKDYLIATKTPKSLVGGGAPTINFSVVDKSTGIKVTQQKSTYNADTNSIDFEAIIESKVQEVIATTKGDDAFAARESRLRGHTVIA